MKKIAALLLALIAMLSCGVALAGDDAYITNFDTEITIMNDGSLQVTETLDYHVTDDVNGFTRDLDPTFGSGISAFSAAAVENGQEREFKWNEYAVKGNEGVFNSENTDDGLERFYIFEPSRDGDEVIMRYRYTLNDVCKRYSDVGVLEFPLIGDAWQLDINNYDAELLFENTASGEVDVRIEKATLGIESWDVKSDRVVFKGSDAGDGKVLRVRVMFPQELLSGMDYTDTTTTRGSILAQEAEYDALKGKYDAMALPLFGIIALVMAFICCVVYVLWDKEIVVEPYAYSSDMPLPLEDGATPAEISLVMPNSVIKSSDLAATLLDLTRRGYLRIETDVADDENMIYVRTEKPLDCSEHEVYALDWMMSYGDGTRVSMRQIESQSDKESYSGKFGKWSQLVKGQMLTHNWKPKRPLAQKLTSTVLYAAFIAALISGIIFFADELTENIGWAVMGGSLLTLGAAIYSSLAYRYSREGHIVVNKWKSVKDWIKGEWNDADMRMSTEKIELLMVYALALGQEKALGEKLDAMDPAYANAMRASKDAVLLRANDDNYGFGLGYYGYYCAASSTHMRATYTSSSSGGGSSGSGGGGGGGGGTF